jgi:hypothetical protein
MPHVLRHSLASLTPDLDYNEPPIATLPGYKAHCITSRYAHSAGADAVIGAPMKLMEHADLDPAP